MTLALVLTAALVAPPPTHVVAARVAAITYRLDPAILLAIAEHETRFNSTLTNGRSCGAMQVATRTRGECTALADVQLSYLEGARMLRAWLDASGGSLERALCGYALGWDGLRGGCRGFDSWVIQRARKYGAASDT